MKIPDFKLDRRLIIERHGLGQECGCGTSRFVNDGLVQRLAVLTSDGAFPVIVKLIFDESEDQTGDG